uniref:DUF2625 family protein n=1 Tax=Acetivibrio cellulolyticus TaxID=35830 RepID=UPI00058DE3DA|nr:DUF2625 family protein [Acetivibrio cellulolyticus]
MKELSELKNNSDPGWRVVEEWLLEANKPIRVLESYKKKSEEILYSLQISTRSILGAVAYQTGGIIVDNGWLRFLGSGNASFRRNLVSWNGIDMNQGGKCTRLPGSILVADDVLGGFFAMNGGAFEGKVGDIFYFAPDSLEWESLNKTYPEFLHWSITGNVQLFYEMFRWYGWDNEIKNIGYDQGVLFYPPLWSGDEPVSNRSRNNVSIAEIWDFTVDSNAGRC